MTEVFSNFAISTLAASIGGSDTIISVAEPANFPASGTFHIVAQEFDKSAQKYKFGNQIFYVGGVPISPAELMQVTAVGGNSFTVRRAQEGTIAYPWPSGTRIAHVVTAAVMQNVVAGSGSTTALSFAMPTVANSAGNNIALDAKASFGYTINQIRGLATSSGSCTVSIQINGTNITGLSSLSVTSTPQDVTATGTNVINAGDRLSLVIASNSTGINLEFDLKLTKT